MGFCGVFWRLHLTARSRETHGYTQGCKGWQKRRASESIVGERIRMGERKRRWPEWWEALFFFFFEGPALVSVLAPSNTERAGDTLCTKYQKWTRGWGRSTSPSPLHHRRQWWPWHAAKHLLSLLPPLLLRLEQQTRRNLLASLKLHSGCFL